MYTVQDFVKDNWYVKTYSESFLKFSNQRGANISCLRHHIPRALEQLQLSSEGRRPFKVLSVGAGDGFVDQEILEIVQEGYLNADKQFQAAGILNTAIEPQPDMVEKYESHIKRQAKSDKLVQYDLKPMSFEKYAEGEHDQNQYDLVHAIHSLYYVDNIETTLKHCYYNELGEKGLIACVLADRHCIIHPIAEITKKSHNAKGKGPIAASDDIAALPERNMWKFDRIECSFPMDVTGILRDRSDEGRMLLDFLTFQPDFYQSAEQKVIDGVLELLKNRSTEDEDGKLLHEVVNELILIYK